MTTGGAYLFAKGLNHDFFLWSEIRSWQVRSKSSEQDEGFIQFSFVGDRPPVKVGDAFVTLPTWERLLQTLRTHAGQQEVV